MDKVIEWHGKYKGIKFEIANWTLGGRPGWAYYLLPDLKQLPPRFDFDLRPERGETGLMGGRLYFKYEESFWGKLYWHGGITFYEKLWDGVGKIRGFKVGCDYQHSFDSIHRYSERTLEKDCKASIDSLWELLPEIKVWCLQDGSYHYPGECPRKLDKQELGE